MPKTWTFIRLIIATVALSMLAVAVVAQNDNEEKRVRAKQLYDEGVKLRIERTYRSYLSALAKFEESARLYEEIGDDGNTAGSLLGLGLIRNLLGDRDAGFKDYFRALTIFRRIGHVELQARTLNNIAIYYDEKGEKQKALETYLEALPLRRTAGDDNGEAVTLNGIGATYGDLGQRQLALDYFAQSLAIRRKLNDREGMARTLNNIGRIYDALGDRDRALDNLTNALALRRELRDREGEAITLNNIGLLYAENDTPKSIDYYEASRKLFEEIGLTERVGQIYNNLAHAQIELRNYEKSLEYSEKALAAVRGRQAPATEAAALDNRGFAKIRLGRRAEAIDDFKSSLFLAKTASAKDLEALVLGNLMRSYQPTDPAVAILYGKQCVNGYQELRAAIRDLDSSTRRVYLGTIEEQYRFLADLLIENGRFGEADEVLQMLKEEEFSKFVRRASATINATSRRVGFGRRERAVVDRYAALAEKSVKTTNDLRRLERRKQVANDGGPAFTPDDERELQRLAAELESVNRDFRTFLESDLKKDLDRDQLAEIEADRSMQARLGKFAPGTVMLTTVVTSDRYRVILTTPELQVAAKTEIGAAELNRKIFAFRELLTKPNTETRVAGKQLYDILVKPIEAALVASRARTLVLSLDGVLRYIPFSALSPDGSTYLAEKYSTVILTPQTRDDVERSPAGWTALAMGVSTAQSVASPENPAESMKFAALPAIEDELKTIVRQANAPGETGILPGRRFLNDDFTLRNLTDSLARQATGGGREFTVVHLASHFRLAPTWSDSFLLLGGGKILTLEDLSGAAELDFAGVDLVTLSACNTASSDESGGRDVDGLAGLIQLKNGKSVLATLWEVNDASTAKLMTAFYRQRRENPSSTKADAVQSAQKTLIYGGAKTVAASPKPANGVFRKSPARPFAHPYYWSSFVLIGNWR